MRDYKIVSARTLLNVQSVSPIRGFLPPSIVVIGDKMDLAQDILFNGIPVLDFIVASKSRLVVRIPQSQIGKELKELRVYSSTNLTRLDATLSLALVRPTATVQGMERLIQAWMMVFLTTPGSNAFDPQSGGGGRAIIGRSTDKNHKSVAADLALAIERTKTELIRVQANQQGLPLSERLLTTNLETINFNDETTVLSARVSIKNMLGSQAEMAIG